MKRRFYAPTFANPRPFILSLLLLTLLFALGWTAMAQGYVLDGSQPLGTSVSINGVDFVNTEKTVDLVTFNAYVPSGDGTLPAGDSIKLTNGATLLLENTRTLTLNGNMEISGGCALYTRDTAALTLDGTASLANNGQIKNDSGQYQALTLKSGSSITNHGAWSTGNTSDTVALFDNNSTVTNNGTVALGKTAMNGAARITNNNTLALNGELGMMGTSTLINKAAGGMTITVEPRLFFNAAIFSPDKVSQIPGANQAQLHYAKNGADSTCWLRALGNYTLTNIPSGILFNDEDAKWYSDEACATQAAMLGLNTNLYSKVVPKLYKDGVKLPDPSADTITLLERPTYTYNAADFEGYTASWSSGTGAIAAIDADNGEVTPLAVGDEQITLTLSYGGAPIVKTFTITVEKAQPVISGTALRTYTRGSTEEVRFPISLAGAFLTEGGDNPKLQVYFKNTSGYAVTIREEMDLADFQNAIVFDKDHWDCLASMQDETTYDIYVFASPTGTNKTITETKIGQLRMLCASAKVMYFSRPGEAGPINVDDKGRDSVPMRSNIYRYGLYQKLDFNAVPQGGTATCTSSNPAVATVVNTNALIDVTALKPGTTTIGVLYVVGGDTYASEFTLEVTKSIPELTKTSPSGDIMWSGKQGQFSIGSAAPIGFTLLGAVVSAEKPYAVSFCAYDDATGAKAVEFDSVNMTGNEAHAFDLTAAQWNAKLNTLPVGSYSLSLSGTANDDNAEFGRHYGIVTVTQAGGSGGTPIPTPVRPEPIDVQPATPISMDGSGAVAGEIELKNVVGSNLKARVFLRNEAGEIAIELKDLPVAPPQAQARGKAVQVGAAAQGATLKYLFPAEEIAKLPLGTYTLWVVSEGNAENLPMPEIQIGVLVIDKAPQVVGNVSMPKKFRATVGFKYPLIKLTDGNTMPAFEKLNSGKKKVAAIGADGMLTANKTGRTVISFKLNGKTQKCTVTVVKNQFYRKSAVARKGELTISMRRLRYEEGILNAEVYAANRTGKALESMSGLTFELRYKNEAKPFFSVPFDVVKAVKPGKNAVFTLKITEEMMPGVSDVTKRLDLANGGVIAEVKGWENALYSGKAVFARVPEEAEGIPAPEAENAPDVPTEAKEGAPEIPAAPAQTA